MRAPSRRAADDDHGTLLPAPMVGQGLAVLGEEAAGPRSEVEAWLRRVAVLS